MKESIKIRNLGPIKDLEIEIKPITFFIGASASGKSTILKAVALFRYLFKMLCIRSYLRDANIIRSPFRIRMESLLKNCGFDSMVNPDTYIEYTAVREDRKYTLRFQSRKLTYEPKIVDRNDLAFFKVSYISENRNIIPTWASRIAANKGASLGFYFHETFNDFNDATDAVKEFDIDLWNVKLSVRKADLGKKYLIAPTDKAYNPIELRRASSGIQSSIPLSVIANYFATEFSFKDAFRRSVLNYLYENDNLTDFKPNVELTDLDKYVHMHIEEPEISADPNTQVRLIDSLIKQCFIDRNDDRTLTIMVATHSPYIINELNVLIKASYYEKEVAIRSDQIAVYKVVEGRLENLIVLDNDTRQVVVNALDMSETMDNIYQRYIALGK